MTRGPTVRIGGDVVEELAALLAALHDHAFATARARSAASIRAERERHRLALLGCQRPRPAPPEPRRRSPRAGRGAPAGARRAPRRWDRGRARPARRRAPPAACSAASRSRPWSRSSRARRASSSQASGCSRPPSTAARRAWGWSTLSRRWRGGSLGQLAGLGPEAVGDLLARAEADPGDEQLVAADRPEVRIGGHEPKRVQSAVEHRRVRPRRVSLAARRAASPAACVLAERLATRRSPSPARSSRA